MRATGVAAEPFPEVVTLDALSHLANCVDRVPPSLVVRAGLNREPAFRGVSEGRALICQT